jgi:hypothetical protein
MYPPPPPPSPLQRRCNAPLQVLGLAMFSHIMQMLFLAYVENPHIERTYVTPNIITGFPFTFSTATASNLKNPNQRTGRPRTPPCDTISNPILCTKTSCVRYLFHNFDLFRASDWTMVPPPPTHAAARHTTRCGELS